MSTYFFVIYCRKENVQKLLGRVHRSYLHTFSHDERTMIRLNTDEQTALVIHQSMGHYVVTCPLKAIGGRIVERPNGVAPIFIEKRSHPDKLRLPPKPENYKPFRMSDMPWYAELVKR